MLPVLPATLSLSPADSNGTMDSLLFISFIFYTGPKVSIYLNRPVGRNDPYSFFYQF